MEKLQYNPGHTIEDYLTWEGEWELWEGVPVSMSPAPNKHHQRVAGALFRQIQDQLEANDRCDCEALYEVDWHIDKDTVLGPDIVIECEPDDLPVVTRPPALIVEILSPSTAEKDRTAKRIKYAEQGVGYYLLADPATKSLEVLQLVDGAYQSLDAGAELSPGTACRICIDADALWR